MDYIRALKELISVDTSVPPGLNYGKAIDLLEPYFQQAGFTTEKVSIPPEHAGGKEGRTNLLAHRRSPGKPRLIFYAHVDVVPAEGWEAFRPREEGGKIYGRGAADMKGGITALLQGLDTVKGKPLKYDTSVMLTTDEETGQASQIRYLGRFLEPLKGAYLFSLDSSFGYVSVASLGALHIKIRVKGKSVHSGLAHLGENAIEKANLLLSALADLKKRVVARKSRVLAHPDTGLAFMEPRLNVNMIQGGLKVNIVPDECTITIDRRLIPEENLEEAEAELMSTLSSVEGVNWEVAQAFHIPTLPPLEDPIVSELVKTIEGVTGEKSGSFGEMGSGDFGPVVTLEWGAKHFGLGVIRSECNIHGKDEYVYRKDIEDVARIIARFVTG
ncbi:MAG: M20/M25/M40 family metallo-hydrolase [Chloroflexota bacterium]